MSVLDEKMNVSDQISNLDTLYEAYQEPITDSGAIVRARHVMDLYGVYGIPMVILDTADGETGGVEINMIRVAWFGGGVFNTKWIEAWMVEAWEDK